MDNERLSIAHRREQVAQASQKKILTSIDGIGEIIAAHFLAEIGDINRFLKYQNLIAFCGTNPEIYQPRAPFTSGRITKHGNASSRKYVYLMTKGTVRRKPFCKTCYDKKRSEEFPHWKAMGALMNKLLRTIFALLTKQEKFVMPSR